MQYLYVMVSHNPDAQKSLVGMNTAQTGDFLYSLIGGLRQKDLGFHTITNEAMKIREYSQRYKQTRENKFYADSGGYSILSGLIPKVLIPRVLKTYQRYLQYEGNIFDYIFTLDVAYSKKHPEINKKQFIYDINKLVLRDLICEIERNPNLMEKVFFVWHFKMLSQYEIFKYLYREMDLAKYINNYSIGGMVGMRTKNSFNFSPFTPMVYRCLLDHVQNGKDIPFRLHFLGMYLVYDRFQIAFLEKMCRRYLFETNTEVFFSYDSINFEHTARLNKNQPIYDLENRTDIVRYDTALNVPDSIISAVYNDSNTFESIKVELDRRRQGLRLFNSDSLGALSIYSNLKLDRFFENIIEEYEMDQVFFNYESPTAIQSEIKKILKDIKNTYAHVFSNQMIQSIEENMDSVFIFHNWFVNNKKADDLDGHIKDFIRKINFGDYLT